MNMRILRNYILRQHLVPFLLGFGVVTFILEMDVLFDYLDLIVNRGVAPGIVLQLFGQLFRDHGYPPESS